MQMEIEAAGDRLTARIKGELDHHSAAQARAQLDALLTDETRTEDRPERAYVYGQLRPGRDTWPVQGYCR